MKICLVPSEQLTPKDLRVKSYINARTRAKKKYEDARAEYLRLNGWVEEPRAHVDAPVWWTSPHMGDTQRSYRATDAAQQQELRDNAR